MESLRPATVQRWMQELSRQGFSAVPLAAGVEGAVFLLGDGLVAKVWNSRSLTEVGRLASFYEAVAAAGLPFSTPEICDVRLLGDVVFSVERELSGTPLHPDHTGRSPSLDPVRLRCVADVLSAFAAVTPSDAMKQLPVLDELAPFRDSDTFNAALIRLVKRRLGRSIDQVRMAVANVDDLVEALEHRLDAMPPQREALVHGDLIPANILVDDQYRVTAVLDFGFFSTVGPAEFDAAVVTNIFDMYGPDHAASRVAMEQLINGTFGYPPKMLATYLAAYALATITMFGSTRQDGHFLWCAEVLRRPDVVQLLATA